MKEIISLKNQPLKINKKPSQINNKENSLKKQKYQSPNPEKSFGKDITLSKTNTKYEYMVPKHKLNSTIIPTFLIQKQNIDLAVKPYEEQIINLSIDSYKDFSLDKKRHQGMMRNVKRIKVIQFFMAIGLRYKLKKKTLFLSTYIYDKYLCHFASNSIMGKEMTILAQVCLLIAMKYEEIYPPFLKDWGNNIEEVIKMEAKVLKALDFKLIFTSAQDFLELYLSKNPEEPKQKKVLYQCLLELFLISGAIYQEHPLKIVQIVTDSFRNTILMENNTEYRQIDKKVRLLIKKNEASWEKIIESNHTYYKKELK